MKATRLFLIVTLILVLSACKPPAEPTNPPEIDEPAGNNPADEPDEPAPPDEEIPENTIIVNSTDNSGPGTLRQVLEHAQENDYIVFDPAVFPPDAPTTIFVLEELPHIRAKGLTIDASNAGVILKMAAR